MNEKEWLGSTDPAEMMRYLTHWPESGMAKIGASAPSNRKLSLFAAAVLEKSILGGWGSVNKLSRVLTDDVYKYAETGNWSRWEGWHAYDLGQLIGCEWAKSVWGLTPAIRADILRHIFGNPFRLIAKPQRWTTSVIALAEALYGGEDCAFALYDALTETGQDELANHFWFTKNGSEDDKHHPKGCWALDLILGKE